MEDDFWDSMTYTFYGLRKELEKTKEENKRLKKELYMLRPGKIEHDLRNELSRTKKERDAVLLTIKLLNVDSCL